MKWFLIIVKKKKEKERKRREEKILSAYRPSGGVHTILMNYTELILNTYSGY